VEGGRSVAVCGGRRCHETWNKTMSRIFMFNFL